MYMMTMPVAEARAQFSQIVESAMTTHERIEVTKNGRRAAVLLGAEDFDAVMETLDILSDTALMAEFSEARRQIADGQWAEKDEITAAMREVGRLDG